MKKKLSATDKQQLINQMSKNLSDLANLQQYEQEKKLKKELKKQNLNRINPKRTFVKKAIIKEKLLEKKFDNL